MATVATPSGEATPATKQPARQSWIARNHFWLRRIHSLTGIIPVGAFLLFHFYENGAILSGNAAYNAMSSEARNIRYLALLEIFVILLPILYHALYGLYIAAYARNNTFSYGYGRNNFFMVQRVTGIILVAFILYHVWEFRLTAFWEGPATASRVAESFSVVPLFIFYIVGIVGASIHLGNGIWSFLITWGITVGLRAQRISEVVTNIFSVLMSAAGIAIAIAFVVLAGGFRWWF